MEKADSVAAAVTVVADGELNVLPGCNVNRQCSSGMVGRTKESEIPGAADPREQSTREALSQFMPHTLVLTSAKVPHVLQC